MKRFFALTTLLILTACAAATIEPITPTAALSITPPPTTTLTPTVIATRNPIPTWPPPTPTPDFMDTPIVNGYLLAPSADSDCQLPCWQGLHIGESGRDEVQITFEHVLEVHDYDFFNDYEIHNQLEIQMLAPISLDRVAGYEWESELDEADQGLHFLQLRAIMDESEETLEGLSLFTGGDASTPQKVLQEIGAPSDILLWSQETLTGIRLPLVFFYSDKGVVIFFSMEESMPVIESIDKSYVSLCLNDKQQAGSSYILRPFDDMDSIESDTFSLLYEKWIEGRIPIKRTKSIEEVSDISIGDLTDRALSEENTCIEIDYFR